MLGWSMTKPTFRCPASMVPHVRKVLAGEYDVPGMPAPRTILDIGANVGAFAVWAHVKWPDAYIQAYEPHPTNIEAFKENVPGVTIEDCAVYCDGRLTLWVGASNCGEHSLWPGPEQSKHWIEVEGMRPERLDACDFLKIDAEGAELGILAGYRHLETVQAVALETHSARDARVIQYMLEDVGLTLVSEDVWRADRSVQRWLRKA